MKHKILISLTGAVLSSSLATSAAFASTIFSGNTQIASVNSSRKLPAKLADSRTNPIFRVATPELPSNIASASGSSVTSKPQNTSPDNLPNTLGVAPEVNPEALPNGDNASNGNNENTTISVANPAPTGLPASFADPIISPSVELAVNPYVVPEVIPEVAAPAPNLTPFQRGEASWYGPGFDGNYSANGERFNRYAMTAAHPSLPFGTRVLVTNTNNGRSVVVRINDRGPFSGGRVIDLSQGAAASIGMIDSGVADVQIDIIQP